MANERHIRKRGSLTWCGELLNAKAKVFESLDEAEGRLTDPNAKVVPCKKCWNNIHLETPNDR